MSASKILKSLLIAALLSCTWAHANEATTDDGNAIAAFKVSEMRCQLVEGQVRCTFG